MSNFTVRLCGEKIGSCCCLIKSRWQARQTDDQVKLELTNQISNLASWQTTNRLKWTTSNVIFVGFLFTVFGCGYSCSFCFLFVCGRYVVGNCKMSLYTFFFLAKLFGIIPTCIISCCNLGLCLTPVLSSVWSVSLFCHLELVSVLFFMFSFLN